jgi:hypothetical protein
MKESFKITKAYELVSLLYWNAFLAVFFRVI